MPDLVDCCNLKFIDGFLPLPLGGGRAELVVLEDAPEFESHISADSCRRLAEEGSLLLPISPTMHSGSEMEVSSSEEDYLRFRA
jgi:hypothetical protein